MFLWPSVDDPASEFKWVWGLRPFVWAWLMDRQTWLFYVCYGRIKFTYGVCLCGVQQEKIARNRKNLFNVVEQLKWCEQDFWRSNNRNCCESFTSSRVGVSKRVDHSFDTGNVQHAHPDCDNETERPKGNSCGSGGDEAVSKEASRNTMVYNKQLQDSFHTATEPVQIIPLS